MNYELLSCLIDGGLKGRSYVSGVRRVFSTLGPLVDQVNIVYLK